MRYTAALNGVTEMAITKLDVLSGLKEIRVCVAYEIDGKRVDTFPADASELEQAVPVLETLPGWMENIEGVDQYENLPQTAQQYLDYIAKQVGIRISMVSTGPKRSQTIAR